MENSLIYIGDILINYQREPIGIETVEQIGWIIEANREVKNVMQMAYQVQVSELISFKGEIYDTGKMYSDESAHVKIAGLRLQSAKKYYIRVKVWTNLGESAWQSSSFVTAILNKRQLAAQFISAETDKDKDKPAGTLVRKRVTLAKDIVSAYAFTTAYGLYHFYINGKKVSRDEFTPGWTSYHKHLLYQVYDVREYLKKGENVIGALLGAGWYKGTVGFRRYNNHYGKKTAFFAQVEIHYSDGSKEQIITDSSWQGENSAVVFSEIYDGETYDARKEIINWCNPQCSYQGWKPVQTMLPNKNTMTAQSGAKCRAVTKLETKKILLTPNGETVLDFGQNLTGWVEFKVEAAAGDVVELRCFEVLDMYGNVYLDNLRTAKQTIRYICGGNSEEVYHPYFSFQGFRYVHIISYPGELRPEKFHAFAVHSDMKETGTFECSDLNINQLQHNIKWSMKGNFLDVPTDCPQRDERLGWTGDAQIFCRTASYLMDTYTFYRKWLQDAALDSDVAGAVPHVVPDILTGKVEGDGLLTEGTYGAAAWADVIIILPWTLYLTYGDKVILEERYKDMKKWIDYMTRHADNHIWNYQLQFGDWVALDSEEGSCFGATPNDLTCTAFYAYSTEIFSKVARVLGYTETAKEYQQLYKQITEAYYKKFFSAEGHLNVQTQTAQILTLYFGLVKNEHRAIVTDDLLRLLAEEEGHLVTGFVGTPYFCHVLSQNGHEKEAYELLLKEDYPSWLYQVKQGATTIWEHWDGIKPDGSMWSPDMNSFNHYAYGSIGEWLYRVVGGIEIDEVTPGYKHITIAPHIGGNLKYVKASYESLYGRIKCAWYQLDRNVKIDVTIPINTTAHIQLSAVDTIIEDSGIKFTGNSGSMMGSIGSGTYTFIYQMQVG